MSIWKHTICGTHVDDPLEPAKCPKREETCDNPTLGFNDMGSYGALTVWECKSCSWLTASENMPLTCPVTKGIADCPNPTGGSWTKVVD